MNIALVRATLDIVIDSAMDFQEELFQLRANSDEINLGFFKISRLIMPYVELFVNKD